MQSRTFALLIPFFLFISTFKPTLLMIGLHYGHFVSSHHLVSLSLEGFLFCNYQNGTGTLGS